MAYRAQNQEFCAANGYNLMTTQAALGRVNLLTMRSSAAGGDHGNENTR